MSETDSQDGAVAEGVPESNPGEPKSADSPAFRC